VRHLNWACTRSLQAYPFRDSIRVFGIIRGAGWLSSVFQARACNTLAFRARVAQKARGVVKGVTRASFGRRAPLMPQLQRASTRRREEEVFRGVQMIQQVAAVHLGWGQAPSLDTKRIYESTIWVLLKRYGEY